MPWPVPSITRPITGRTYRPYYYGSYYRPYYYGPGFGVGYAYGGLVRRVRVRHRLGLARVRYGYGYPYAYGATAIPTVAVSVRYYYDNRGAARLEVRPREAQVFIDGYFVGAVDDFDGWAQRLYVAPGEHELAIYLKGHRTYPAERAVPARRHAEGRARHATARAGRSRGAPAGAGSDGRPRPAATRPA